MSLSPEERLKIWDRYTPGPVLPIPTQNDQPSLFMKRLDLIQSWASGNKYYKLKYVLQKAMEGGVRSIISKGGMFSNHLAALSDACLAFDIHLICVVRSYNPDEENPCIQRLRSHGHDIQYLTPDAYRAFDTADAKQVDVDALFIPEGGLSAQGILGASEIVGECLDHNPDYMVVAGGTMSTAIGILSALPRSCELIIVPAWKGCTEAYVRSIIHQYQVEYVTEWRLWPDDHFGGFGKFNDALIEFIKSYKNGFDIPLDPVYTGKLMYALDRMIKAEYFRKEDTIMAIHSGGLQGLAGFQYRFAELWDEH